MHSLTDSCAGATGDAGTPALQGVIGLSVPTGGALQLARAALAQTRGGLIASFAQFDATQKRNVILASVRFHNTSLAAYRAIGRINSTLVAGAAARLFLLPFGEEVTPSGQAARFDLGAATVTQDSFSGTSLFAFDIMIDQNADTLAGMQLRLVVGADDLTQKSYFATIGATDNAPIQAATENYATELFTTDSVSSSTSSPDQSPGMSMSSSGSSSTGAKQSVSAQSTTGAQFQAAKRVITAVAAVCAAAILI